MSKHIHHEVKASGTWGKVLCVRGSDETCPAGDFLDALPPQAMAQFKARLNRLAEAGNLKTPESMRQISSSGSPVVYEIKAPYGPGYRLYCIRKERRYYATHGGKKVKKNRLQVEVDKAREIFREDVAE